MPVERRGRAIRVTVGVVNWQQEEPRGRDGKRQLSRDGTSRVTGDSHARICERLGVKFPGPTRRYTRIQGALKNVGHRVGRSTIARILKAAGVPPQPERPTSWQTFLRAHWGVIAGADFFTTEVWTWRGLVTYYTVFVIDLASRREHILGSTPHPHELFMRQVGRTLTTADDGLLRAHRVLICDRAKWSGEVRRLLSDGGIRVVQTPWRAPNANAHAERFVRSIKHECLDRVIPLGERHFQQTVSEYVVHYHHERNHQGLDNKLIEGIVPNRGQGRIRRRPRLGGLLNYYERAA
jgi:putative transposase